VIGHRVGVRRPSELPAVVAEEGRKTPAGRGFGAVVPHRSPSAAGRLDATAAGVEDGAVLAIVSPGPYLVLAVGGLGTGLALCVLARLRPGLWSIWARRAIGTVLAGVALVSLVSAVAAGDWATAASLPLALCNAAAVVVAVACWWPKPLLVELAWFWGLAGTLQAVITPDLTVPFPNLQFFEYTVGHVTIVVAAVFLVVGLRIEPRPGAPVRVFLITLAYALVVGFVDAVTDSDYMFLRAPPDSWSLLSLLGPWPWYLLSATGVAIVLLALLNLPFWLARRQRAARATNRTVVDAGARLP
jgi:hypothetical integral membrane protein (TIGR02206 family)